MFYVLDTNIFKFIISSLTVKHTTDLSTWHLEAEGIGVLQAPFFDDDWFFVCTVHRYYNFLLHFISHNYIYL